jgi:ribosomal protein L14E/L6E/L27E
MIDKNNKFIKNAFCLACGKHIKKGDDCVLVKTQNKTYLILCTDEIKRFGYKQGQYKVIKYGIIETKPKILREDQKEMIKKYINKNKRISGWMKKNKLFYDYALSIVEENKKQRNKAKKQYNKKEYNKKEIKKDKEQDTIFNYLSTEQKQQIFSDNNGKILQE